MKKVIRIIFRVIICIFLLITFLFLLNTAFGYQISWINFLLRLPTKDLVILIYMGWILVSLIAWAFSNWFDDLNILKSDIEK